jgi:hypothetical protein
MPFQVLRDYLYEGYSDDSDDCAEVKVILWWLISAPFCTAVWHMEQ